MKYLPFEDITLHSRLSKAEVISRIQEIIEPPKVFRFTTIFSPKNHKPFAGSLVDDSFNLYRVINHRNSFLPRILGRIVSDHSGSRIRMKMKLHPFVIAFILLWCSGVGAFVLVALANLVVNTEEVSDFPIPMLLVPLGMISFLYAITMYGFKSESKKAKVFFVELLQADIESE